MDTAALRQSEAFGFPSSREISPQRKRLTVVTPRQREVVHERRKTRTKSKTQTRSIAKTNVKTLSRTRVEARARIRARVFFWIAVSCVTVATVVLLITSLLRYNELSGLNRNIRETATEVENLRAQHDTLTMQLAPYIENSRIENLAKRRLGMRYPSKEQVLSAVRDPAMMRKDRTAFVFDQKTTIAASPQHEE